LFKLSKLLKMIRLRRCCEKTRSSRMKNTLRSWFFLAPSTRTILNNLKYTLSMKNFCVLTFFMFVCLFALPASAFTPNDEALSLQMQKNYGALTSWEAEMSFPSFPGVTVHIWYAHGKWRQEWKAGDTATAVGMNGSVVAKCTAESFPMSPLFVWMPPNPVATWRSWGADNATRNYGFCGDSPCFMFGAEPGDETSPAVFLNNEDLAPILVRFASGSGVTTVEFAQYRTLGGFRVPQMVTMNMGAESLEAKVKWIAVNRAEGEELYVRDALDSTPCAVPPSPFDILRDSFRYPQVQ